MHYANGNTNASGGGTDPMMSFRIGGTAQSNEKMRILSNGNIGIGNSSPGTYKLNVTGDIYAKRVKNIQNLTLVLNSRAEWRKYTIDGHKKYLEYQEQLRKNLGPKSPAIYNGMAWGIYQRIRLGLSKDKKSDIKKLVEYSKACLLYTSPITRDSQKWPIAG